MIDSAIGLVGGCSRRSVFYAIALTLIAGCTSPEKSPPSRFASGLTLVALSEDGSLIDAVYVPAGDDSITEVIFHLPENLDRMRLVLWGDRIDASVPRDVYFTTSSETLGGNGLLVIHLQDGIVTAIDGNGTESPVETPSELIEQVAKLLDSGEGPKKTTEIVRH